MLRNIGKKFPGLEQMKFVATLQQPDLDFWHFFQYRYFKVLIMKINRPAIVLMLVLSTFITSCVGKKKYRFAQSEISRLQGDSTSLSGRIALLEAEIEKMNEQLAGLGLEKSTLQNRLATTSQQLDETSRQSAERLAEQQRRLEQLQGMINRQRETLEGLRKKMADALVNFNASELSVTQKNGKVYVSMQEKLLFPSGSAVVNAQGKEALGQLAKVLQTNPDISVNIEGHTDSIPIRGKYEDNWALSVARATSIVRILTETYKVDPERIIASGHSQYDPVDANATPEGRARNRRTEIILTPRLDELYKLIEEGAPQ